MKQSVSIGNKKVIEQRYLQLQMLAEHIKQMQLQLQQLDAQVGELTQTHQALSEFAEVEQGSDILVALAGGIFTKAKLGDSKEIIVNIGGRTAITKTIPAVQDMLSEQISEIRKAEVEMTKQLQTLAVQAEQIQEELASMA
ncbi:MAG: prefoldin subunit alpha [Nanoarchaeota archaeon]